MSNTGQALRVLVVDDERVIADSLALILRMRGYEALAVYTAETAIRMALDLNPHALLSDVIMPEMNGVALATYFTRHYPHCKVLLMSGNTMTADLLEDARLRGYEFTLLHKPTPPNLIFEFLESCVSVA
jgi:DNA-binding NtrC family response regulator